MPETHDDVPNPPTNPPPTTHFPQRTHPTAAELQTINTLLQQEPLPTTLRKRPEIPRLLLSALHSRTPCTKPVTEALLTLCKPGANLHRPADPSPFRHTRQSYQKSDIALLQRAHAWATKTLTSAIRGEHAPPYPGIAHGDPADVFVAPRDVLDTALAKRYAAQAADCLRHPRVRGCPRVLIAVQAALVGAAVVSEEHALLCVPVLEQALNVATRAEVPLLKDDDCELDDALETRGVPARLEEPFSLLSDGAKADLCGQSTLFRALLRRNVEDLFERGVMEYAREREVVSALARAAVADVTMFWDALDEMRSVVSGAERPFSLALWRQRHFFRALFAEVMAVMMEDADKRGNGPGMIVTRFPPFGRPLVRLLLAASDSLQSQDMERQLGAVSSIANLIWRMIDSDNDPLWTPNLHALMISVECLLEPFCWAATHSFEFDVSDDRFPKRRKRNWEQGCDPLTCVCYLTVLMETPRLPGGDLVEKTERLRSAAESTKGFLRNLYREDRLDMRVPESQIRGLHAFAVCGILGRADIKGSLTSAKTASNNWEQLSHALDRCALWTSDKVAVSRYKKLRRALEKQSR